MSIEFKWNDDLAYEFASQFPLLSVNNKAAVLEQFKSSKAPKKEWEVVAYHFKPLRDGDKLVLVNPGSGYWTEAKSGNPDYGIHAVCRLSDGEVFSCKEKVGTPYAGQYVIHSFAIEENEMIARFTNGHPSNGYCNIKALKKLPAPVLTTVDGVEVELKEGNMVWVADSLSFKEDTLTFMEHVNIDKVKEIRPNYLFFSSEQARDNWITDNRPLLSLNDVKACMPRYMSSGEVKAVTDKLTALVKQKLNQ